MTLNSGFFKWLIEINNYIECTYIILKHGFSGIAHNDEFVWWNILKLVFGS